MTASGAGTAPGDYLSRAREALRAGNYLLCYDLADRAQQSGQHSRELDYLSLLALANAGSNELAWSRFQALGLAADELDEDWLALEGRLLKNLALSSGSGSDDFQRSAEAYLAAFRRTSGFFTGVNAATLFLLAGDVPRARRLAQEVLDRVGAARQAGTSTDPYYLHATDAEAALLLGDLDRCRASLAAADRCGRGNLNARSRTRVQLELIAAHLGLEERIAERLSLPATYCLDPLPDGCEAPPSGADFSDALLFAVPRVPDDLDAAQLALAAGARLRWVLPEERSRLLRRWEERHGAATAQRLSTLLDHAEECTLARGLALLTAQTLGSECRRAALLPGRGRQPTQLGATAMARPRAQELEAAALTPPLRPGEPARRLVGLIFADIAGSQRLPDEELPRLWTTVMAPIAGLLRRYDERILYRHTWGDALHVVTEDALTAAEVALGIRACIDAVRRSEPGVLGQIELRLALHYAPVTAGYDPIEDAPMFYGSQIAFAARVEPVTPPGMVFVTEAFAARLALESGARFQLEYAGEVELAKRFGRYRLFSLRPGKRGG